MQLRLIFKKLFEVIRKFTKKTEKVREKREGINLVQTFEHKCTFVYLCTQK